MTRNEKAARRLWNEIWLADDEEDCRDLIRRFLVAYDKFLDEKPKPEAIPWIGA